MRIVAFSSASGGTLRRPATAYMASNSASRPARTSSTTTRIRRIGCSAGIKSSVDNVVNIAS